MRHLRAALGIAAVAVFAAIGAGSTGSAVTVSSVARWEITASVVNGYQHLSRISNSSTPGHKGQGSLHSAWGADWRVKVKIIGPDAYIVGANAFRVTGNAHGEYRGSYPKSQTETAHFTCPFGPVKDNKLLRHLHVYGIGRTDAPVHVFIGIQGEPGVLPPLNCGGDKIDAGTPKTISGGVLTGIESACFGNVSFPGVKLKRTKRFEVRKRFGWHPDTPSGFSRPCSGFGAPIRSSGEGTLHLSFHPVR